jgi:hypothetical protein
MVLLVAGGALIGYAVTRKAEGGMAPQATGAMGSSIAQLDGDISIASTAVEQRAKSIAENVSVKAVVGTDAETAAGMANKELAFKPDPGDVIELGQLPNGGDPIVLFTVPAGQPASPHDRKPGAYEELVGGKIRVTRVVGITPSDAAIAAAKVGFVTVTRTLDLKPAIQRLVDAKITGSFHVGGESVPIGAPPPPGGSVMEKALPNHPSMHLVVDEPPVVGGVPCSVLYGGAGVAGFGLLLLLLGLVTGKSSAAAAAATSGDTAGMTRATTMRSATLPGSDSGINARETAPGVTIGRWEVVRRLGSGGMADVYLARSKGEAGFEKLVALKVMHAHLARNERAVEHFLDEARLAATVHHPNVVAIQDLGKIGNDYAIVMEYVDGVDLERLLLSARSGMRPVPIDVGLGILRRICDGLHAAHTATSADGAPLGIIHRDVKSANVLVSRQGGVKVVDFGIAKAANQSHLTVAGETKGTPSMMAPEQRVGEQVDVRADVYSVAAVGFEVMTNHGVNLDLAALAHLGVENWPHLPPPSSLRAGLPPELDALLLGAMSFERDKRPANCAAFESLFEDVMKKHGLSATDKDIARWVDAEGAHVPRTPPKMPDAAATDATKPQTEV